MPDRKSLQTWLYDHSPQRIRDWMDGRDIDRQSETEQGAAIDRSEQKAVKKDPSNNETAAIEAFNRRLASALEHTETQAVKRAEKAGLTQHI